jgi:hypothetical protein
MPTINIPTSGHAGPAAIAGWQWLPFTDHSLLVSLQHAVHIISSRINGNGACNAAFSALPGGRTFSQVWADATVWISYDPGNVVGRFGATLGKDITLSRYACRMGAWTMAATLVHELAHVNGASGATHDAEGTLGKCLLKAHEDPAIIGQVLSAPRDPLLATLHKVRMV